MSAKELPYEILAMIFENLKGSEAGACRAVCRRWRDVVDSLSDEVWERYCCRDFCHPKSVNRVSDLSYRELYKSLAMWSKVEEATLTYKQLLEGVHQFKILNNDTLAVPVYNNSSFSNTVHYYSIKNMELISSEYFDVFFSVYDENEKLIALMGDRLWIITKSNKKKFIGYSLSYNNGLPNFKLFHTEVYFLKEQELLFVAQLKVVESDETIETQELQIMHDTVLAFGCAGKNSVNILTDKGMILWYEDRDLKMCIVLHFEDPTIFEDLMGFGFDWTERFLFKWLEKVIDKKEVNLPKIETSVIHCHNHVILVGTLHRTVHIFKDREINLYKAKPNKTVDLGEYTSHFIAADVKQIGVVEVLDGHRLIILNFGKLFYVDLLLNNTEKGSKHRTGVKTSKRKAATAKVVTHKSIEDNGTPPNQKEMLQKNLKKNENKKPTKRTYSYNTRSKDNLCRNMRL